MPAASPPGSHQVKDYYAVLGVERDASSKDIRQAYRSLARAYHPDVGPDHATGDEAFKEINEANRVLSDPKRRERYDRKLGLSRRPGFYDPPEPSGGTPVAVFGKGTPLEGMRIMRQYGELFMEGGDEIAAVAVLEFDRLGQLDWVAGSERDWVVAEAGGRPAAATGSETAAGQRSTSRPRPRNPFYVNAKARGLVEQARTTSEQGRFDAALKLLRGAEPSARLGDAEVARGIAEVARSLRDRVSGERRAECEALLTRVGGAEAGASAETGAAEETGTAHRPPRSPRAGGRLSWLRRPSSRG